MRRRRVVFVASTGLPVQSPACEGLDELLPVAPVLRAEGSVGEAAGMQQDLRDRHDFLSVRPKLRDDVGHSLVEL